MPRPTTVDEYLASLSEVGRERLSELRRLSLTSAPEASEAIKWGSPAYLHPSGVILFMLSAHRAHANIAFTPSTRAAFDAELADYETGKGTVKLPYDQPVPDDLLRRMIEYRIREHEDDGVMWM
ncbi:MAG TPA: DUF1801 domain-containing protein [Microthrixaceae bacterium]|nr:DUF1801 domain-containing protein [Microthrixaceae bacterium]